MFPFLTPLLLVGFSSLKGFVNLNEYYGNDSVIMVPLEYGGRFI